MAANLFLVTSTLVLAVVYAWVAYTSGRDPSTAMTDLLTGALFYVPLLATATNALIRVRTLVLDALCWWLLGILVVGTSIMALVGYNAIGALIGLVNFAVNTLLAVRTFELSGIKRDA